MGKLYLYYKKHNSLMFGDFLKVKIDEKITNTIEKNKILEQSLDENIHNIKMYFEGWTKEQLVGYIDEDIEIKGNTYYIYKAPSTLLGKGKFYKVNYASPEEFKKYINKINIRYNILDVVTFILILLILIILLYL